MFDPRMMMGGGMSSVLQGGVGGPMAGPGPTIPQNLTPPIVPAASPDAAMQGGMVGGGMQGMDPRVMAMIRALMSGGGGMPTIGR